MEKVLPQHIAQWYPAPATVCRLDNDVDIDRLLELFQRISTEEGWQPDGHLGANRERSIFFGLWTESSTEGELSGGIHLTLPDEAGCLPCHGVWPEAKAHGVSPAHVSILAVGRKWRGVGGGLFWLLAAEMWRYCVQSGIDELLLEATPRTYRCYSRLGFPLEERGPLRIHWGEPCLLGSMKVRDVGGELTKRAVRSSQYRNIVLRALLPTVTTN